MKVVVILISSTRENGIKLAVDNAPAKATLVGFDPGIGIDRYISTTSPH